MREIQNAPVEQEAMYELASELFPIHRSLSGSGVRHTLEILRRFLPDLTVHEVPSGTHAFDWIVPDEWNVSEAWVEDSSGTRVIDASRNNLHLVAYSTPVDAVMSLAELQSHLHSLPGQPDAIPYVTSYYAPNWGFCLAHRERERLRDGQHRVVIDSTLHPGSLTYGELILKGAEEGEVLLSTYVCHPSMANNEVSGPAVTTYLARWISALATRRFTYRILFVPETIGSIVYLSRFHEHMRRRTIAGFVVTCVGDDRSYSFMPSRTGRTLADKVALHVLRHHAPEFRHFSYLQRGSDERQYCSPGIDLPVVSVMRTKYGEYPEYHTSLDDLSLISPDGLGGAFTVLRDCLRALEDNQVYLATTLCEPQLGRRGLYPLVGTATSAHSARDLTNVLAYADGEHDLIDLAEIVGLPFSRVSDLAEMLLSHGLLRRLPTARPNATA